MGVDPFRQNVYRSGPAPRQRTAACCRPGMESGLRPPVRDGTSGGEASCPNGAASHALH